MEADSGTRAASDWSTRLLRTVVALAKDSVCGEEDLSRSRWRVMYVSRGERTLWRRVVNWAEMEEGKMKMEARRATAEWNTRGIKIVRPICGAQLAKRIESVRNGLPCSRDKETVRLWSKIYL